jgi:hypothetical protein
MAGFRMFAQVQTELYRIPEEAPRTAQVWIATRSRA